MKKLLLVAAALAALSPNLAQAQYRPKVGTYHVDFRLPRIDDGQKVELSELRGKKVMLIHFASW